MLLRHFYNEKLAQASYLVGCPDTGEAIIIDPARNIRPYLESAAQHDLRIVAITETHIHADFVSGASELAEQTGATLLLSGEGGEGWQYTYLNDYAHVILMDGDTFDIGNVHFEVIHTPGHTPEHLSLKVTAAGEYGLFSGDFMFVGDLGRPDLLEKSAHETGSALTLARQMFASVQRFKQLPEHLLVFPGHGAGSACGKALGAVPSTTVGYELRYNPLLQIEDEETFARTLIEGQSEPPRYFKVMKRVNRDGPRLLKDIERPDRLPPIVLTNALHNATLVVDTRPHTDYAVRHLPGTINIEMRDSFPNWTGKLLDYETPFYVISDDPELVKDDLFSVGLDNLVGIFPTSVFSTLERTGKITFQSYDNRSAQQLYSDIDSGQSFVLDVRREEEWQTSHIPNANHIPLEHLMDRIDELPRDREIVVYCATGIRSAIGASMLQANGFTPINMDGGYVAWRKVARAMR